MATAKKLVDNYSSHNSIAGIGILGVAVLGIPMSNLQGLWIEQCKNHTVWEDKSKGPNPIIYCSGKGKQ